jgi:hypothetical protein
MKSDMVIEKINDSYLYYDKDQANFIREYYLYCVELIKEMFSEKQYSINLIFGNYFSCPPLGAKKYYRKNKVFRIDFQIEHTLVKPEGIGRIPRIIGEAVVGNVRLCEKSFYLIYVQKFWYYKYLDYVIDYSIPNLINVSGHQAFKRYGEKLIVISPLLYAFDRKSWPEQRSGNVITTFVSETKPRRNQLLKNMRQSGIPVENVVNCYSKEEVRDLYLNSKILVNVHQTPYHDTFEELRVLPALLCGCIVVSEDVPLKDIFLIINV